MGELKVLKKKIVRQQTVHRGKPFFFVKAIIIVATRVLAFFFFFLLLPKAYVFQHFFFLQASFTF